VNRFWKRLNGSEVEARLRRERPAAPRELVDDLVARIEADSERASQRARPRVALVSVVTAVTLFAFGATGGLGYSKSAVTGAVSATAHSVSAVVTKHPQENGQGSQPAHQQYKEKVLICHNGHTISVSSSAVPAHLRHGDTLGPCP
jgi:hypothetical protein